MLLRYRPERVLHGIMPVFTFMSAGILRQDDVFSFHIIEQTVKHVVPAVMAASPDEVAPRIRSIVEVSEPLGCGGPGGRPASLREGKGGWIESGRRMPHQSTRCRAGGAAHR